MQRHYGVKFLLNRLYKRDLLEIPCQRRQRMYRDKRMRKSQERKIKDMAWTGG